MATTMTPDKLFRQLLEGLQDQTQPWEDRTGITFMAAAAGALAGCYFAVNDNITDGVTLKIHLPTGDITWHRPRGEDKVTPGPDNAARIRACLAGQAGE